jgi:ubiquinone/menaquinone biosynthesis C-methylase UbiE
MKAALKKSLYLNSASKVGLKNQVTREKWLQSTLKKIPKKSKILDAGAGELQYKKFCSHLRYFSQDFGEYDGAGNKVGLQTDSWDNSRTDIVSDIASIPVPDKTYDAVMCIEVFEHIPHPIDAIQEFSRILKKNGYLIITVPVSSLTHFAPYYYYNGYSRYFFEKYLAESGFTIKELSYNGNWFEAVAQELRRLPDILSRYSSQVNLDRLDRIAINRILEKLEKGAKNDSGSDELLSHGIHVLARKN